jgi:DNA gyrase subunit A
VLTARVVDSRGELVGALMVQPDDEVFAITSSGGVIRTSAGEVKLSGRQTMGVRLMNLASGDSVVAIARNAESLGEADLDAAEDDGTDSPPDTDGETGPDGGDAGAAG